MKIIYADNFRGFRNTFLELEDVNFFIGDNSSGKTSLLSLIALLSKRIFPNNQSFSTEDFELGNFDDIANQSYKKEFTIGYISSDMKYKRISMLIMSFQRGSQGTFQLRRYKTLTNRNLFRFEIRNNKIYYLNPEKINSVLSEKDIKQLFVKEIKDIIGKQIYKLLKKNQIVAGSQNNFIRYISAKNDNILSVMPRSTIFESFKWIPPIRTSPKRIYEWTISDLQKDDAPFLLHRIYNTKKEDIKNIEKAANKATLFKSISFKNFFDNDTSPFAIELNIGGQSLRNIYYLGYGVSQALPVITDIITSSPNKVLLIQQPEVHLHPKAQAAIGDIIFHKSSKDNQPFIIETHSDYIIDRFRLAQNRSKKKVASQIIFFSKTPNKNSLSVIKIEKNGSYSKEQPRNFRDFFIKESLQLLEI